MQFIISDIHGCFYTLEKLIHRLDRLDPKASLIFVGDYMDRGLHSNMVMDYLLDLKESRDATFLRGNHDDVIDWLVNKHCMGNPREWVAGSPTEDKVIEWWTQHGFSETVQSYGVLPESLSLLEEFRRRLPESHKEFLRSLQLCWENETHFACHAYFRPSENLPRTLKFLSSDRNEETMWSRFPQNFQKIECKWDKIGVFGHTPVSFYGATSPLRAAKIRLIDTAAFMGGYLCAYNVENDDFVLQNVDDRDISADQKRIFDATQV